MFYFSVESRPALGLPRILSNGHRRQSGKSVKVITRLHATTMSRMVKLHLRSPIRFLGIVINYIIKYKDNFKPPSISHDGVTRERR